MTEDEQTGVFSTLRDKLHAIDKAEGIDKMRAEERKYDKMYDEQTAWSGPTTQLGPGSMRPN